MPTVNGHQSFKLLVKVQNVHEEKMLRRVNANLFCLQVAYDKADEICVHETLLNCLNAL